MGIVQVPYAAVTVKYFRALIYAIITSARRPGGCLDHAAYERGTAVGGGDKASGARGRARG